MDGDSIHEECMEVNRREKRLGRRDITRSVRLFAPPVCTYIFLGRMGET